MNLIITRMGDSFSEVLSVQDKLLLKFGWGIGPVMTLLPGPVPKLAFVRHSDSASFCIVDLK